ncbi:glucan biosynthesis glucosyltransferase H [Skermanella aerolata]|uniref:Glucans biosynthesis glucosyltransferase H n=1 Tax=Skermanella aerolata TaxID=393310 RepID=A0A512DLI6_9PROT|nr:glucans biosynthesis glucosyltransferase MdoH [Skermanella aerolata]KJB96210.1 glucosyl transferase [Skermanella aerolata KACC 11604]GEO37332.1 glucan biosynthesis glucosyltransferase H [Skermanella aerolata]
MTTETSARVPSAVRRAIFLIPVLCLTLLSAFLAAEAMGGPRTALDWVLVVLFTANLGWLALNGWQVVLGFVLHCLGSKAAPPLEVEASRIDVSVPPCSRTAVVLPIYNEDVTTVFAAVGVMARSLARTGEVDRIDLFVLSDTRDEAIWREEERAYDVLLAETGGKAGMPQVFYRRRLDNAGRKAGNLADFCTNWGHHYDFMVVLDADSLMSGDTIRRMIRLMEDNGRIGLIQTVSHPVNRETLFARIHQFAANLYTPLSVLGLNFWSQEDANYWGHNAIVRIKAFMAHCDLPVLPGKAPLGGEILCHDVVEACLMRRGPWEVRLLPELGGTWEELPGNTIDYAGRDKRWCQGNLQHMRFLPAHGLRWPGRMHILMGIMCYLSAPIWFAFLVLSAGQLILGEERGGYGLLTSGLFNPGAAASAMFALTLTLLFLPKVLSIAAVMADGKARRGFGGGLSLLASALLEQVFSTLQAPVLMAWYSRFVASTLAGRIVAWDAQPRGDRGVGLGEAFQCHAGHVILGLVMAAAALLVGPVLFWWMSPIILGLVLSPALTSWSSRRSIGLLARRLRLFLIPAETAPEPELREMAARAAPTLAAGSALRPALPPRGLIPMIPQSLIRRPLDQDTVDAD